MLGRREILQRRRVQRSNWVLPLSPQPEHSPTRRQDLELRASGEQRVELGRDAYDLLEVVEHEQYRRGTDVVDRDFQRRSGALDGRTDGFGDARDDQLRLGDGCQRHERDALRRAFQQLFTHRDR